MDMPTGELVEKFLPLVNSVRKAQGRWSGYETAKAERVIKFRAKLLLNI
jgi:hypothetical protein